MKETSSHEVRVERLNPADVSRRLVRLRRLAWLYDQSIPIGRFRIGLDPLLGLIPGGGDVIGAVLSFLIIYDAARLGLPLHVLVRMAGNVLLETIVGVVPLLGDLFDFAWQANIRNLALVDRHYDPLRAERPNRRIARGAVALVLLVLALLLAALIYLLRVLWHALGEIGWR